MNSSKRRERGFIERTIDSSVSTIWNMWWFVMILALTFHGHITKHQLVHTAFIWSLIWAGYLLIVLVGGIWWEVHKARKYARPTSRRRY